jgi:polygalacturonase
MAKFVVSFVVLSFFYSFQLSNAASTTHNVIKFGAKPDGKTDATQPFLKAWSAACRSATPSTIYVPRGRYLLKAIVFRGPCKNKITVLIGGTLVAPTDYRALGNSGYWILFIKINRVSVFGGTLDAKGAGFWACRKSRQNCPVGARVSKSTIQYYLYTYPSINVRSNSTSCNINHICKCWRVMIN